MFSTPAPCAWPLRLPSLQALLGAGVSIEQYSEQPGSRRRRPCRHIHAVPSGSSCYQRGPLVPASLRRLADRTLQKHRRRQGGHKRVARFTGHHVFRRGLSRILRSPVGSTYDLRSSVTGNDPATESNRGRQLHLDAPDSPGWPTSVRMSVNPGYRRDKDRTIQGTTRRPGDQVQFNHTLAIYSVVVDHVDGLSLSRASVRRSKATATKTDRSLT